MEAQPTPGDDKFQKRYDFEKKIHLNQGAQMDSDNGSIIKKGKKDDKIGAQSREGNIALEVDRPVLPTQSFESLKEDLLSSPAQDELQALGKPQMNFLKVEDEDADEQDTCIMVSFPRSGNTLLRAYLEKIMGLTSGSDCDISKKLNKDLMLMGLAGEGLVDKRVWVVKTHYPERYGKTKFYAERAILLVRDPLDCMTSLYNMVCTGSHNKSISDNDFQKYPLLWSEFIQQDITVWKDFHDFWINAKIPVHIVRYEDIVSSPEPTLKSLLEFILNIKDISGTKVHHYLKLAVSEQSPQIYKPRQGVVKGNLDKFNKVQLEFIGQYSYKLLKMFKYEELYIKNKIELGEYYAEQIAGVECNEQFIDTFNHQALIKSISNQNESDEVTSIYVNYPALLLRKKSEMYPNGRTSHKFKQFLRRRVTIVDKNKQVDESKVQDQTELDDAEKETD